MTAARFSLMSPFRTTLGFEDRCVVAEALLAQFFHQLDRDRRDTVFAGMFLHTLLHHRTEEIGDAAEPQGRCFIPLDVRRFLDVEGHFNLLAAFGRVQTPLIFVQPISVIYIGTSAASAAD